MKVKELIQLLEMHYQDSEVVMSKDAEGNQYSPFSGIDVGVYDAETTWYGEFYSHESDIEEYASENSVPAICLWPVN